MLYIINNFFGTTIVIPKKRKKFHKKIFFFIIITKLSSTHPKYSGEGIKEASKVKAYSAELVRGLTFLIFLYSFILI
jgi:hypothetical protein